MTMQALASGHLGPESTKPSFGFSASFSSRFRCTQVTRMIRPPGLHTRCISLMNLRADSDRDNCKDLLGCQAA